MNETFITIASDPIFSIGSFILAVIGIALAIIFFFRSQKEKVPCFEISHNTIIEGLHKSLDGLAIQYKGSHQERITVTKVLFWNAEKKTIDYSDLVTKNKLRVINPEKINILDTKIIKTNSTSNSVNIDSESNFSFDYLDHEDYFVIQIVHNGCSNEKFKIEGKIKGVKKLKRVISARSNSALFNAIPFFSIIDRMISSPVFMKYIATLIYASIGLSTISKTLINEFSWPLIAFGLLCTLSSFLMYFSFRHVPPEKI